MIERSQDRYSAGVTFLCCLLVFFFFFPLSCRRTGTQKTSGILPKVRWKVRTKHTFTLDPAKSERADDAVHRHSLETSRGNELTRKILVRCRISSLMLVLLTATHAPCVRTIAETTVVTLQSVDFQHAVT